jgi:hypothetical protein
MPPKENKVALIMQSDDLSALELRQWRKSGLEHPPDSVTKSSHEAVEDKFGMVGSCTSVSLLQPVRSLSESFAENVRKSVLLVQPT